MAKVNKLFNGGSAPWWRLVVQVVILAAMVCIAYGRIDSRVDTNKANIADSKEQRRIDEAKIDTHMVDVINRLARIEGALGVKKGE